MVETKIRFLRTLLIAVSFSVEFVSALGSKAVISASKSNGALPLFENGRIVASIHVNSNDYPGVIRAAHDLSTDFGRVTGQNMSLYTDQPEDELLGQATAIIIGTIGKSKLINSLVSSKKIDVSKIKGKWESFQTQIVQNPVPGISQALVIVGSDKRGSIFGIYEVSEQIGVSPWYYWADVAIRKHSSLYALNTKLVRGEPSIKYRGIFLNDEAPALTGWVNANFPRGKYGPGFNHEFYSRVFELLLRLKANFLWPAMWDSMFGVDDPKNQETADFYGIVMSTSHTEPLQMSTKEWNTLGNGTWDYTTNSANIDKYWKRGVARAKDFENMWTVGMRGNGDNILSGTVVTELLEKVVSDQRKILSDVLGVKNISGVPQVWCLYKDIQAYYEHGMRVPEDITLLWTDDNWGNVRRLPLANETNPAGMYYHFDFVGDPRDYKWINTVSLQKTWEQLHLTYERNARNIWVVNVGDLKPLELPIDYYLNLAYDYDTWGGIDKVIEYEKVWAAREFGEDVAKEVADIVEIYGFYAARRRYELVDPKTYSIINYNEAEIVLKQWQNLTLRAEAVYAKLHAERKPAFFEMVLHPIKAAYIIYDIHVSSAKNNLYAYQRRSSANALAEHVLERFQDDHDLTQEYNMLGGKWSHMMDQTHLGYNYWQQPMRNTLPPLAWTQLLENSLSGTMGVAVESSNGSVPGDDHFNSAEYNNNTLVLPQLDPYAPVQYRTIEIFARGTKPFDFKVSPHNSWVHVSPSSGHVDPRNPASDVKVKVSVDWNKAPAGYNVVFINITSSENYGNFDMPSVNLPIHKPSIPPSFHGFVESNKLVSIEASHASRKTKNGNVRYETLRNLGRTGDALTLFPVTCDKQNTVSGARLEYDLFLHTAPTYGTNITVYLGMALNNNGPDRPLKYAISFDDAPPQEIQFIPNLDTPLAMPKGWDQAVSDGNVWKSVTQHKVGAVGKKILKLWALEPSVVFQKVVIDLGGVKDSYLGPPESVHL
ncbi:hypothetical protein BZA77DRAFT_266692 [Pyronema omphalodes]|nr:hypothetical protein BZA77DRAFT_266692 [Pyronema omphalodes]